MAHSVELVNRLRHWPTDRPCKIDPKAGQHQEPGDEDKPVSAHPPDASRRRIFAYGDGDLLLPSKNEQIVHSFALLLSMKERPIFDLASSRSAAKPVFGLAAARRGGYVDALRSRLCAGISSAKILNLEVPMPAPARYCVWVVVSLCL